MSKRKRIRAKGYNYATKCPACAKPMVLVFDKPKPAQGVIIRKKCIIEDGCLSDFQFTINKKILVDAQGEEFPLTITRRVITLTEEGRIAYEARKEKPKVVSKNPFDKMT